MSMLTGWARVRSLAPLIFRSCHTMLYHSLWPAIDSASCHSRRLRLRSVRVSPGYLTFAAGAALVGVLLAWNFFICVRTAGTSLVQDLSVRFWAAWRPYCALFLCQLLLHMLISGAAAMVPCIAAGAARGCCHTSGAFASLTPFVWCSTWWCGAQLAIKLFAAPSAGPTRPLRSNSSGALFTV